MRKITFPSTGSVKTFVLCGKAEISASAAASHPLKQPKSTENCTRDASEAAGDSSVSPFPHKLLNESARFTPTSVLTEKDDFSASRDP